MLLLLLLLLQGVDTPRFFFRATPKVKPVPRSLHRGLDSIVDFAGKLRSSFRQAFTGFRLLLAVKASIAVLGAWLLALLLPGDLDKYAYYAPLGALLGVTPTVVGSIRTTVEMVTGIVLGVLSGWLLIATGMPWFLRPPVAAGIGVCFAGVRLLGEGRVYVAITGVFVVILGVDDPQSYGASYIVQFGLGLVVGTIINLLLIPPLTTSSARSRVAELQRDLAAHLHEISDVLISEWPPDRENWVSYSRDLRRSVDGAETAVDQARDSAKANLRTLWRHADVSAEYASLARLRDMALWLSEITEALTGAIWDRPIPVTLPEGMIRPLAEALTAIGDFVHSLSTKEDSEQPRRAAIERCDSVIESFEGVSDVQGESGFGTIVFAIRNIRAQIDADHEQDAD